MRPRAVVVLALPVLAVAAPAAAMGKAGTPIVCIKPTTHPTGVEVDRKYAKAFDVVLIKDGGHFIKLEKPQELSAALARVLAARGLGPQPR